MVTQCVIGGSGGEGSSMYPTPWNFVIFFNINIIYISIYHSRPLITIIICNMLIVLLLEQEQLLIHAQIQKFFPGFFFTDILNIFVKIQFHEIVMSANISS